MKIKNSAICFVTPYSLREITGVGKFVEELHISLKKRNIDSFVITKLVRPKVETSIRMVEINCDIMPHFRNIYLAIITAIEIFKHRKNIKLLHLQTPRPQSASAALIGRILGIPVVTTVHGKFPPNKNILKKLFYKCIEKITFINSNKLIFVSKDSKDYFKISNGLVVLNGVDTEHFYRDHKVRERKRAELGIGSEVVFIYVGRWVAHKGIYNLLDAFAEIISKTEKKSKLIFVGTGESEKVFERIKNLKISKDVIPVGIVDSVKEYFCAADVFVLFTSPLEGLPLALLEAMSCGVVPIASDVAGISEVITDGENGFLVNYGNQFNLLEKMTCCVNNTERLNIIGENASDTIKKNYSLEKMSDEYVGVYTKWIKNKS